MLPMLLTILASGGDPVAPALQGSELATVRLSLDDAVRLAEQRSPLVRRARAAAGVVAAGEVGAGLFFPANPVASLLAGRRAETSTASGERRDGLQYVARLEQTVEIAGQRQARRTVVARAIDVASFLELVALSESRARIRTGYMAALIALVRAEAARDQESVVNRVLGAVRVRVQTGAASEVDLRLAEAESGRLARQHLAAELAAKESLAVLVAFVGLPPGSQPVLMTKLSTPEIRLPPLGDLLLAAESHRADLRALTGTGAQLDAELSLLTREAVPNPTLAIEIERDLPGELFLGAGVVLPLPAWRRNQGERAIARAERQRVQEERLVASREVGLEVEQAYGRVLSSHDQAVVLEKTVVPATKATVDLITEGWQAGKFDLFRVLQATREAADARRSELDVLAEFWRAVVDLDRATGAS
jgi:outer membrane protein, heavy metal efflux system